MARDNETSAEVMHRGLAELDLQVGVARAGREGDVRRGGQPPLGHCDWFPQALLPPQESGAYGYIVIDLSEEGDSS